MTHLDRTKYADELIMNNKDIAEKLLFLCRERQWGRTQQVGWKLPPQSERDYLGLFIEELEISLEDLKTLSGRGNRMESALIMLEYLVAAILLLDKDFVPSTTEELLKVKGEEGD